MSSFNNLDAFWLPRSNHGSKLDSFFDFCTFSKKCTKFWAMIMIWWSNFELRFFTDKNVIESFTEKILTKIFYHILKSKNFTEKIQTKIFYRENFDWDFYREKVCEIAWIRIPLFWFEFSFGPLFRMKIDCPDCGE